MTVTARDRVPSEPFRRRVEELQEQGVTFHEIALRAGFFKGGSRPHQGDVTYLKRLLGLSQWSRHQKGEKFYGPYDPCDHMSYDAAVKLCRALDLDPHEAGL